MDENAMFGELASTPGALEILRFIKDKSDNPKTISPSMVGLGADGTGGRDFIAAAHLLMDRGLMMAEAVQIAEGREPRVVDVLITQRGARLMSPDQEEGRWLSVA